MNHRVLIVRLGAMGDVLHALPAVAMLRAALPEAHIGWVVEQRWRELLCAPGVELAGPRSPGRPLIDELHIVDTRAWRKHPLDPTVRRDFLSAIRRLRACRYDAALDLQGAIKSALLATLAGTGLVLGFRQPRESLARWLYGGLVETHAPHVIEQNQELMQAWRERFYGDRIPELACAPGSAPCSRGANLGEQDAPATTKPGTAVDRFGSSPGADLLPCDPASEARIEATLDSMSLSRSPLAILNPGAGWAAKQWAPVRYGELAIYLLARGLYTVVNYGPGEKDLAGAVIAASKGAALALPTTLSEFVALARRAHLFVGGDTGPMHLAALLGVKTVALFGPTDPARNGPYWPATRILRHPDSIPSYSHKRTVDPGLEQLTVECVLAEIDTLLT